MYTLTDAELIDMAHQAGAEPCGHPLCINGIIEGGEYVTASGEVDWYTTDCDECDRADNDDNIIY